jgi:hypothetical protein
MLILFNLHSLCLVQAVIKMPHVKLIENIERLYGKRSVRISAVTDYPNWDIYFVFLRYSERMPSQYLVYTATVFFPPIFYSVILPFDTI